MYSLRSTSHLNASVRAQCLCGTDVARSRALSNCEHVSAEEPWENDLNFLPRFASDQDTF
jgi:hypothetical protein